MATSLRNYRRLLKLARVDNETLVSVCAACIRPIVEYGAHVWLYNIADHLSVESEKSVKSNANYFQTLSYGDALVKYNLPAWFHDEISYALRF